MPKKWVNTWLESNTDIMAVTINSASAETQKAINSKKFVGSTGEVKEALYAPAKRLVMFLIRQLVGLAVPEYYDRHAQGRLTRSLTPD